MTHYRCYLFDETDRIVSVDTIRVHVDIVVTERENVALEQARQLLSANYAKAHVAEVWDRSLLVGRIEKPTSHTTGH